MTMTGGVLVQGPAACASRPVHASLVAGFGVQAQHRALHIVRAHERPDRERLVERVLDRLTLVGARRRGFTPEGFRLFAERIGVWRRATEHA